MQSLGRIRAPLIAVVALVATVALTSVSSAHRKFYKSSVSIAVAKVAGDDLARGEVDSKRRACRRNRTVILFQESKPGNTGQFLEIGRTKTDDGGNWTVPIQNGIKKGRAYHAQAKTKRVRNRGGHKHICKSKFSPDVIGG